ncbi:MAG: DUF5682 family protein [Dysgonamonadaceae bacterium]|jgi:hypothetical protein|nr:DUF5682 family protein [Dysgonamonadaceae bacterium]
MNHGRFNIFGIRHLSPGVSCRLLRYLEEKNPRCILIEGPSDAGDTIQALADERVTLPVALLAYTTELPIETVLYPFASYSPEYQAICWGVRRERDVRFIDLPAGIMLKLSQKKRYAEKQGIADAFYAFHNGLYDKVAAHYGESDYESYWERYFEHNLDSHSMEEALLCQSAQFRALVIGREAEDAPYDFSYNLIREAHMRREIQRALSEGFKPEEIVIVVGAYHAAGIQSGNAPLSDEEYRQLPRAISQITWMPYSYLRLSSRSGYGAGNKAPYYFELMWEALRENNLSGLPAVYLSKVAIALRERGFNASSADVIEAVRMANALAALNAGSQPVLKDLHDAVVTCLGGGDLAAVAGAINRVDIGTAIGSLPEGTSRTPIQENMNRELKRLKLIPYQSPVAQELSLDLRENLKVKSKEAAFIDLNRSIFLHRLQVLNIHFAEKVRVSQDSATWAEKWVLRWSPEVEIEIVEAGLKGETLEIAAAFELKERLNDCTDISLVAQTVRQSCECCLTPVFDNAIDTLQALLVDSVDFKETAYAAHELATLIQYGDLRRFKLAPLIPLFQQLFLRSSLLLTGASSCDDKAANEIARAIHVLELISQQQYAISDVETWQKELYRLAKRDDLNAKLSGLAFSILLEHNLVGEDDCAQEVSRRLSPGVPAGLGAAWFEGLAGRNHYALLSRVALWKELDRYIRQLDEEEFMRSLVFLRRAFSEFEANQKNSLAELLGELWGLNVETLAENLYTELSEKETEKLDELNAFDFDF